MSNKLLKKLKWKKLLKNHKFLFTALALVVILATVLIGVLTRDNIVLAGTMKDLLLLFSDEAAEVEES